LVIEGGIGDSTVALLHATALESAIRQDKGLTDSDLGLNLVLAITTGHSVGRDEAVGEAGRNSEAEDEDHDHMHEGKAVNVRWVVAVVVDELGVREGEDNADSRTGDVLEADGPDPVDLPVLA
jgi:hypothetical protein